MPTPTEAEVDAWAKEEVNAKAITDAIDGPQGCAEGTLTQGHIRHILVHVSPTASAKEHAKALAKMTEAWLRIERGESFVDVARDVSDDASKRRAARSDDKTDASSRPSRAAADALKNGEMTPHVDRVAVRLPPHHARRPIALAKDVARELYLATRVDEVGARSGAEDPRRHEGRQVGRRRDQGGARGHQAGPLREGPRG